GTVLALAISEIITGGLTYKVRKENTCDYEEMHVAEYDCDFDSATLERYGTESCRQFLNETNHWGESITYRGPLVNCTSISQANELVEVASEYGDAKSKEWYPGAAKKAAYLSLLPGIGLGVVGLAYGFFKKPAESSASQPSVSNNVTSNDSKQTDHYLTLRG
ncbi:MAG: hypothetical protein JO131_00200, partial [Gammaproteobacteria bacterium]|nr:hypothetical protein [Gammaproteobacteria bacterium]